MDTQGLEQTDLCFVFLFLITRVAGTNPFTGVLSTFACF